MTTIILVLMILGLGAAALLGHTADSRDPEYGFAGLVGRTPAPADVAEPAESPALTVPAAWLALPQFCAR